MRVHSFVVVVCLALLGMPGTAHASGIFLVVVQPEDWIAGLDFGRVPFNSQGPTQRIIVRNDGDSVVQDLTYLGGGPFVIVATGGDLATGHAKFWDIACAPFEGIPDVPIQLGSLNLDVCDFSCEDEWTQSISLWCQPGLLDGPNRVFPPPAQAFDTSQDIATLTNSGTAPVTITGFSANIPELSAALASGSLPVTLGQNESVDVAVRFTSSGTDVSGLVQVLAGSDEAWLMAVEASTLNQISPAAYGVNLVPQGAVYRIPITVRNSFPSARTITQATTDLADYVVTGLVGTMLEPGQLAHGTLTFMAATLGQRAVQLAVAFDTGQGNTAQFFAEVVPATFSVTTPDSVPDDGLLDFGTHRLGAEPLERAVTFTNLDGMERTVAGCFIGSDSFSQVGDCPASLPANGTATLTVRFTPDTLGDPFGVATLGVISFGTFGAGVTAHVVATQLLFSATEVAFPDTLRGESVQRAITLTNVADDPLVVPVSVTGTGFSAPSPEVTVPANGSVDVYVEFTPPAAGSLTGTLELGAPNDPDHRSLPLSGTGTSPPGGGSDGGVGGDDAGDGGHHGGGCSAGRSARGVLSIAWLALLVRRRRRATVTP